MEIELNPDEIEFAEIVKETVTVTGKSCKVPLLPKKFVRGLFFPLWQAN